MNGKITEDLFDINWIPIMMKIGGTAFKLLVIYILFLVFKAIGNKIIHGLFEKYRLHDPSAKGRSLTLEGLAKNVLSYILIFIFFVTVLQIFNISTAGILAGAGFAGLAVGFGAQGLVSDIVTGFFILLERQMDVGDYVTTGSYSGIVEQLGLRTTQIRDFDGTLHFIPNRNITSLSNHSRGNMRALVDISIPFTEDMEKTISVLQESCREFGKAHPAIVEGPSVIGVQEFADQNAVLRIIAKTKNGEQNNVERELRLILKNALRERGLDQA